MYSVLLSSVDVNSKYCNYSCNSLQVFQARGDFVPFTQFKRCEKRPWVFFTFFKLYKWYQIAQCTTFKCIVCFSNRMIDGTEVLYETYEKRRSNLSYDEHPRRGADEPPTGHIDCITDITMTKQPQNFLISCARDGVIKVWK